MPKKRKCERLCVHCSRIVNGAATVSLNTPSNTTYHEQQKRTATEKTAVEIQRCTRDNKTKWRKGKNFARFEQNRCANRTADTLRMCTSVPVVLGLRPARVRKIKISFHRLQRREGSLHAHAGPQHKRKPGAVAATIKYSARNASAASRCSANAQSNTNDFVAFFPCCLLLILY